MEHENSGRASVRASIAGVDLRRAKSETPGSESPSKRKLSYNDAMKQKYIYRIQSMNEDEIKMEDVHNLIK